MENEKWKYKFTLTIKPSVIYNILVPIQTFCALFSKSRFTIITHPAYAYINWLGIVKYLSLSVYGIPEENMYQYIRYAQ